ncbi:MAG: hypothetical protein A2622_07685 [Bdellovibrionales bacterium RIFCSPHIGHO2_01_FULL_40_29]|nr:MAG: hypothetical protein A2622_07685 [Bdellovibrionales bacterium RIFCSPHIGHO2_01_FULL_40_29]OFZ34198.1 MAG: hypothetical protein A3D17_03965 [Bdellovibrionales bacterium RIFCSPHIGHO2_02_FULL_40_15]
MPESLVATAFKKHPLYPSFIQVKNRLSDGGYVCWVAGGAVRDFILNRIPFDLDLVTDATTEQIMMIFPEAIPVGIQFGVVKIPVGNHHVFDLATFRRESDYIDGRRPSHVDFATPAEDALRRDFTINALFWDDQTQKIQDFVDGVQDIEKRMLRCVGDAQVRFAEDHLRILRLLRFQVQLKFEIESATRDAALENVQLLQKISGERIWTEFEKMIPAIEYSSWNRDILALSILRTLFPIQNPVTMVLPQTENLELALEYFLLFLIKSTFDREQMRECLRERMRASRDELKAYDTILLCSETLMSPVELAFESEKNGLIVSVCRMLASMGLFSEERNAELQKRVEKKPPKLVDGNDLMGLVAPTEMGAILKKIRLRQWEQPELSKTELLKPYLSTK